VPIVWKRLRVELRLVFALVAVYFVLWVSPYSSFQIRYLVPIVPLAAVLAAAVVRNVGGIFVHAGFPSGRRLLFAAVAMMLFVNLPVFYPLHDARSGWIATTFHSVRPSAWATAAGLYDADRYLAARIRPYAAIQYMNESLPASARVVWFSEAAHFYSRQELVHDYSRAVADGTWAAGPGKESVAYSVLREAGVEYIVWDKVRRDISEKGFAVRSPLFRERFTVEVYSDAFVDVDRLLRVEAAR
jgi:hypothetical protein